MLLLPCRACAPLRRGRKTEKRIGPLQFMPTSILVHSVLAYPQEITRNGNTHLTVNLCIYAVHVLQGIVIEPRHSFTKSLGRYYASYVMLGFFR